MECPQHTGVLQNGHIDDSKGLTGAMIFEAFKYFGRMPRRNTASQKSMLLCLVKLLAAVKRPKNFMQQRDEDFAKSEGQQIERPMSADGQGARMAKKAKGQGVRTAKKAKSRCTDG
ncbi:hypothetical protein Nepgr_026535 [Nepenthes gracilis]|uniref:Uncharacterized protein n=1 Tax=Nepenthes gracilis TaxID=150966 RepID=A0AAD3T9W5_NEPGR|nr:hypothetical protein Nepgr_026535 [Nepenthes gracilis]